MCSISEWPRMKVNNYLFFFLRWQGIVLLKTFKICSHNNRKWVANFYALNFLLTVFCSVLFYSIPFYSILFYSILGCVFHSRKKPSARVQLSLSFAILVHTAPWCPTMSSLQRFGLPSDLTPFIYHSVLLMVQLLSFIRAMCRAHFHFSLVTYWTMSVTLVLCLMMVLRILYFSLACSIFLSMARWLVSSKFVY